MDNIFGIGLPEFILILVIAGMVMGPERIARTARSLGQLTARVQGISRSFIRQLNAELDSVDDGGELKTTVEELNSLRRQVADLRNEVVSLATGAAVDTKHAARDMRREIENSIMPPGIGTNRPHAGESGISRPSAENGEQAVPPAAAEPTPEPEAWTPPRPPQPVNLPKKVSVAQDPE